MVECILAKDDVASSSLVSRSIKKEIPKGVSFFMDKGDRLLRRSTKFRAPTNK